MALTKTPIELSSTPSIVDGGNATAITIDSSENVGIGVAPIGTGLNIKSNGNDYSNGALSLTDVDSDTRSYLTHINGIFAISTNDGAADGIVMNNAGQVTMPSQPAFLVVPTTQTNIPISTNTTVNFNNEVFDQGSNYSGTSFTAPVTGKYQLNVDLYCLTLDSAADYIQISLKTSNRQYYAIFSTNTLSQDAAYMTFSIVVLADMDASDTAHVEVQLNNSGAAQMDITANSAFSGYLVA